MRRELSKLRNERRVFVRNRPWERWILRAIRAGVVLLFATIESPLLAQTQSVQGWPEVDAYLSLNSNVRLSFLAAATRENREGTSAEIGPNIDFYFKPLVKLKRITVFELDPSKSRLLTLRFGHRYMPETNGPT